MDTKLIEFLAKEVPGAAGEIREALDLLSSSIDSSISLVAEKANNYFKNKDFKKVVELSTNSEQLNGININIQEVVAALDNILDEAQTDEEESKQSEEELNEKNIPNYSDYLVDTEVEHNLYEDLTHKRPCAFKIEGEKIEVRDWKDTLIKTVNFLGGKDPGIIREFVDNPKMNGKKVIYFSRVKLPTMRAPRIIDSVNIYIETNLSANGIRNLLVKVLNKYSIKLSDYKIYLRADYSELH